MPVYVDPLFPYPMKGNAQWNAHMARCKGLSCHLYIMPDSPIRVSALITRRLADITQTNGTNAVVVKRPGRISKPINTPSRRSISQAKRRGNR